MYLSKNLTPKLCFNKYLLGTRLTHKVMIFCMVLNTSKIITDSSCWSTKFYWILLHTPRDKFWNNISKHNVSSMNRFWCMQLLDKALKLLDHLFQLQTWSNSPQWTGDRRGKLQLGQHNPCLYNTNPKLEN